MNGASFQSALETFLLLLLAVVVFAGIARKFKLPYPIMLVIAGLVLSLVPGIPRISLQPDLVFLIFLPPLLYSAGWVLSWREFRDNFARIVTLAVGLVSFTIFLLVFAAGKKILPGFDWQSAVLLGAVVAATDAIAATSIARRVGLPRQIVDILEAESLVNDGTGLLALQFGMMLLLSGRTPTVIEGVGRLFFLTGGGILIGLVFGAAVSVLERWIDDGPIEIAISIFVPYAVYLAADGMHTSGVMAVIACSMYMSRASPTYMSPPVRLQAAAVWDLLTFVLNGIVFILIGLQLPFVMAEIHSLSPGVLLLYGALFSSGIIVVRMLWIYGETYLIYGYRKWFKKLAIKAPEPRKLFVLGWGGMRGVLSLAAAVSLPFVRSNGEPFQQRSMIVYLAFCVIVATLVVQGLTMPWVIRVLNLSNSNVSDKEEQYARRTLLEEALAYLNRRRSSERYEAGTLRDLMSNYQRRLDAMPIERPESYATASSRSERQVLVLEVLKVERQALLRLRDEGHISDEVVRSIQRELDLSESHVYTGSLFSVDF